MGTRRHANAGNIFKAGNLSRFIASLQRHRASLVTAGNVEALDQFDSIWGLDKKTSTFKSPTQKSTASLVQLTRQTKYLVQEAKKTVQELHSADDHHIGLAILHCFMTDLLGCTTMAARIFGVKSDAHFEKMFFVSFGAQCLAGVVLLGMNFFFVYYSLLLGFKKGYGWQVGFMTTSVLQVRRRCPAGRFSHRDVY